MSFPFYKINPYYFVQPSIILQFFTTEPYACDPLSLPKYPPTKEMDAKRRDDEARRYLLCKVCLMHTRIGDVHTHVNIFKKYI